MKYKSVVGITPNSFTSFPLTHCLAQAACNLVCNLGWLWSCFGSPGTGITGAHQASLLSWFFFFNRASPSSPSWPQTQNPTCLCHHTKLLPYFNVIYTYISLSPQILASVPPSLGHCPLSLLSTVVTFSTRKSRVLGMCLNERVCPALQCPGLNSGTPGTSHKIWT